MLISWISIIFMQNMAFCKSDDVKLKAESKKGSSKEAHYLGHRARLREKFQKAPQSLADYEILELFLFWIYPRIDTKPMAKDLMNIFNDLSNVFFMSDEKYKNVSNLNLLFSTLLVREIARRMTLDQMRQMPLLNNTKKVLEYCKISMAGLESEQFCIFFLDKKHYLIKQEVQEHGTVDQTSLYPREVVKKCLHLNASGVIMVHNHPSGDPSPSNADVEITKALFSILSSINVMLLDHLIVAKFGYFSFRESRML